MTDDGNANSRISLKSLSRLLYKHYGWRVIILIDEYDALLYKASENGYYRDLSSLIMGSL